MKFYKLFLFSAFLCAITIVGCNKKEINDSSLTTELTEADEDGKIEEVAAEEVEDILDDYDTEVTGNKIDSIWTDTENVTTATQDPNCSSFKYAGYTKIKISGVYPGVRVYFKMRLKDTIDDIIVTPASAIAFAGTPTRIDSVSYYFQVNSEQENFKAKKLSFKFVNHSGKKFSAKMSFVQKYSDTGTNGTYYEQVYGTNSWGADPFFMDSTINGGVKRAITAEYIPARNDILVFGGRAATISTDPTVTPAVPATATKPAKSAKYKFKYIMYNTNCLSNKVTKTVSKYASTFPASILAPDGITTATHYWRQN